MNRYGPTQCATNLVPCTRGEKHALTDTIELIFHKHKPKDIRETYVKAVCLIKPHKTETRITRLAAGGNIIDYPGEVSMPTSDLTTMKIHVNSTISDIT